MWAYTVRSCSSSEKVWGRHHFFLGVYNLKNYYQRINIKESTGFRYSLVKKKRNFCGNAKIQMQTIYRSIEIFKLTKTCICTFAQIEPARVPGIIPFDLTDIWPLAKLYRRSMLVVSKGYFQFSFGKSRWVMPATRAAGIA